MALTEAEIDIIVNVRRTLSAISSATCIFIIVAIILFQKYRFPNSRLVLWLSISSALQTIAYFLKPEHDKGLCIFQSMYISFFDWAIASW
jgi:ABC-type Na+ efflux pump permease subunit